MLKGGTDCVKDKRWDKGIKAYKGEGGQDHRKTECGEEVSVFVVC